MDHALVCDTTSFLGMKIEEEFVVVSLSSGKFFHFNSESEEFFRFFKEPRTLSTFFNSSSLSNEEREYLNGFCGTLLKEGLLTSCDTSSMAEDSAPPLSYQRPRLLREGEKRLSEFEFSYP